jgi:hypothetical protein
VIKIFTPGDSLLIRRLQKHGLSLDLCRTLTEPWSPLREAWLAFLTGQLRGQVTLVWRNGSRLEGVIQVQVGARQVGARITYLAPRPEDGASAAVCARLIEAACAEVGGRGAPRLFAEIPAASAEMEALQQLGFALYARQTVFRLAADAARTGPADVEGVRPWQTADEWAVQRLCVAITPPPVRQAEGPQGAMICAVPEAGRLVLVGDDQLAGVLYVHGGRLGYWLRMLVRPEAASEAAKLLRAGLSALPGSVEHPVFCGVRHYQSHLWAPLDEAGFEMIAEQALMVRHLAARVPAALGESVVVLKQGAEPAAPTLTHAAREAE